MTLPEFYPLVGGDYSATFSRIPSDALLLRFLKKYPADGSFLQLREALAASDAETAFRAAHTLKGVAQNLGLERLYQAVNEITEVLRPGNLPENDDLFNAVAAAQQEVLDAIAGL